MNSYFGFGHDGERMQSIHAINARYIFESLPRRLYHHSEWGTLEYSTLMLPPDPEKGARVMIGICHNPHQEEIRVATYILYEDGSMYMYDADRDVKLPYGIRYAHLQMLLSSESLHDWIVYHPEKQKRLPRAIGATLEAPAIAHQPMLYKTMEQARAAYAQIVSS